MKTLRLVWTAGLLLLLAATAAAGPLSDVGYELFWLDAPGGPVKVWANDPLPPGSNTAPNNHWRYDYSVLNKSSNALNTFYAYFNSDNSTDAQFISGTAPIDWTILKQGPVAPNNNYKIRYRTTVTTAMIPQFGTLLCSATFTWTGSIIPGPQNYDAVTSGGSESGVTPVQATTWAQIKALYR
jgi:hypothetical protein